MTAIQKAPSGNRGRPRRTNPVSDCPLTAALAAIGGKWKLIILYWLADSPRHFAAIRREMPSISQKVLTQQLRELVSDDIILRTSTGRVPAPVEYSLTDYGRSLLPLVEKVRTWGRGHIERFREPPPGLAAIPATGSTPALLKAPIGGTLRPNRVQRGGRRDREPGVVSTASGGRLPTSRSIRG